MIAKLRMIPLLADSNAMPVEKKVMILALFGAMGLAGTAGLFASSKRLEQMSGMIGTKKPIVARLVCFIATLVGWGAVLVTTSTFLTHWDD